MNRSLVVLVALLAASASAQDARPLAVGTAVADTLGPGGRHVYSVDVDADHVVYGAATQETVDVVVTVTGPDGRPVARIDRSVRGAEPFQFRTGDAGAYRVEVSPFGGERGRFALVVDGVEPVAATPLGRVDQTMRAFDRPGSPGAVVAVLEGGEATYARAYGSAVLSHGVPNTPETVFNLGSVSKQFAGVAFAILADRGALGLDDPVRDYLPELPDLGTPVTLRHLLNHTSGLRETYGTVALSGRDPDQDRLTRQGVIDVARRQRALQFEPGSEFLYNSSAYVLLTTVLERVTGQPYPDWMEEHVFGPLGMASTTVEGEEGQVVPNAASSYEPAASGYVETSNNRAYYGAADVYSTVGDLARWVQAFETAPFGGAVRDLMLERPVLGNGATSSYGLGVEVGERGGRPSISHAGATAGYRAALVYFPEERRGVVVLSNTPEVDLDVVDALAESFLGPPEPPAEPGGPVGVAGPEPSAEPAAELADVAGYVGRYVSDEVEEIYRLAVEDGALVVRHRWLGEVPLRRAGADEFEGDWPLNEVDFLRDAGGELTGFTVSNGRTRGILFERLPER